MLKLDWEIAEKQEPPFKERWRGHRFVNKPVVSIYPTKQGYINAFLNNMFYYEDVYYKFTEDGMRFSYYPMRGYNLLKNIIMFPERFTSKNHKNVYVLEKVSYMKYKFKSINRIVKINVKNYEQD
jgi:hypothetical protein